MKNDDIGLDKILKGPIRWPGTKNKSVKHILPLLPVSKVYMEPFGGVATIMINRKPSKLEIYNDVHRGLVSFFKCLRDYEKCKKLCDLINYSIHSREDFDTLKVERETTNDIVLRAFAWYYTLHYSFSARGSCFGRSTSGTTRVPNIRDKIPYLFEIHRRFKDVQVESLDFKKLINDYAAEDVVVYCDPPYIDKDHYGNDELFTIEDHLDLINMAQISPGFFAISGYPNEIYGDYKWDKVVEWEQTTHMAGMTSTNSIRPSVTESLWIKDNR